MFVIMEIADVYDMHSNSLQDIYYKSKRKKEKKMYLYFKPILFKE